MELYNFIKAIVTKFEPQSKNDFQDFEDFLGQF